MAPEDRPSAVRGRPVDGPTTVCPTLAARDPTMKLLVVSPVDLIPDFIPVLGYLDDLVPLPVGIMTVCAMISGEILV